MRKKVNPDRQARQLAVLLAVVGAALAALGAWRGHIVRAGLAAVLAVLAVVLPWVAWPAWAAFYWAWMRLAHVMSVIMTTVILTACYVLIFVPVGWGMRLAGRDALGLRWSRRKPTYWIERGERAYTLERYEKQY